MNPKQSQPENLLPHLEQMMVNMHDNAQHGHAISENILEKTAEHTQTVIPLLEHQLLKQDETVKALGEIKSALEKSEESAPEVQKVSLEGVSVITIKGDKGDKGDSPSLEELESVILPLIPDPIKGDKGDAPTPEELVALIKPLIPKPIKGDKGDKPTPEEIKALIPAPIPGPKGDSIKGDKGDDGKDANVDEVVLKVEQAIAEKASKNPEFRKNIGMAGSGYLRELSDVDTTGIAIGQALKWNGLKWIPFDPSTSGGGAGVETPADIPDGTRTAFTVLNTPKFIITEQGPTVENIGYTLSGLTITMNIAPKQFIRSIY